MGADPTSSSGNGGERSTRPRLSPAPLARPSITDNRDAIIDSVRALMLIRVYRVRGHLMANFDPLGLEGKRYHPELDPKTYGFTEADMDRPIFLDNVLGLETATLREIVQILRETYCGSIGVEFMHIQHPDEKAWIQQRIEGIRNQTSFTAKGKRTILERLIEAEEFERFLHVKFTGTKRFGLDGGETTIPAVGADPEARQPARRRRGGLGDGASRPAERARQHHVQALRGDLLGIPGPRRAPG